MQIMQALLVWLLRHRLQIRLVAIESGAKVVFVLGSKPSSLPFSNKIKKSTKICRKFPLVPPLMIFLVKKLFRHLNICENNDFFEVNILS